MTIVLLDEGVPRLLAGRLRMEGIEVLEFPEAWKRLSDAALLDEAVISAVGVLVTGDQNMPFQTPLRCRPLAVLILPGGRLPAILDLAPEIARRLPTLRTGHYAVLGNEGSLSENPTKPLWR